jgi:hypothetical protein
MREEGRKRREGSVKRMMGYSSRRRRTYDFTHL